MHRIGNLIGKLVSDENLGLAIDEVNRTHHWGPRHKPNGTTAWVETTKEERVKELRKIILRGFRQHKPKVSERWDPSALKWRTVSEPIQWPDQYVHHALIQMLQPIFMRGMDPYCCGSIRGRGSSLAREAISRWMDKDQKGTRYELTADIRHFYDSLTVEAVMERMRQLIKDWKVLDLIERIVKGGVLIGAYTSQWFANTVLQPLDQIIRQSGLCKRYERYVDNLTIFGSSKRKLRKLKGIVDGWLRQRGMKIKDDWQVFRTVGKVQKVAVKPPRKGFERPKMRMPDAVGYRYGRGYIIPRKHNLIRMKRAVKRFRKREEQGKKALASMAASLMSRVGQLKHCNNYRIYKYLFHGERLVRKWKRAIRAKQRKEALTWSTFLEQWKMWKSYGRRAAPTPA